MTATQTTIQSTSIEPVQRLLDAIVVGAGMPDGLFTDDAVLAATVPMWRYDTLSGDLIASGTVFCGGRWSAEILADMEAAREN